MGLALSWSKIKKEKIALSFASPEKEKYFFLFMKWLHGKKEKKALLIYYLCVWIPYSTKEYGIYYRELNKDMLKEKAKEYREVNKDKISTKLKLDRITCECGCTSRRDKISQHKKSSCHQKLIEEKNKLKRNLTDEELHVFFRTNYTFQNYPKGILITSYSHTI